NRLPTDRAEGLAVGDRVGRLLFGGGHRVGRIGRRGERRSDSLALVEQRRPERRSEGQRGLGDLPAATRRRLEPDDVAELRCAPLAVGVAGCIARPSEVDLGAHTDAGVANAVANDAAFSADGEEAAAEVLLRLVFMRVAELDPHEGAAVVAFATRGCAALHL